MVVYRLLYYALGALMYWILADAIAGWVVHDPAQMPLKVTRLLTEPMYAPIRSLTRAVYQGPIDFSPLVWLLAISAVRRPLHHKLHFGAAEQRP